MANPALIARTAVLLNSGGPDSAVAGALGRQWGYEIASLYIEVGQLNAERAKAAAVKTAEMIGAYRHDVVTVGWPEAVAIERHPGFWIVPYVNSIAVSTAGAWARHLGASALIIGYRDGKPPEEDPFYLNMRGILSLPPLALADDGVFVELLAPVAHCRSYTEVMALAPEFDLRHSVSCGQREACGHCWKCKARLEAGLPIG